MLETIFRLHNLIAVFDILIVSTVLYWLMLMFKGTRAERMLWGIAIIVIVYFMSQRMELLTLHWILSNFLGSIVIFIIVVFQQDIRRALVQMGKPFSSRDVLGTVEFVEELSKAVSSMSKSNTGALVVLERGIDLSDFLEVGVDLDCKFSKEMLLTIFHTESPMHDGAVLVRGSRIAKAGCILPLTEKELPKAMGTRHRAAVGLAEETDAVIIVVSESTGDITLVVEGEIKAGVGHDALLEELKKLFSGGQGARRAIFPWRGRF